MNVFRNETHNVKILSVGIQFACSTWMCCERGEGEEEVENQGWSRVKVSSQGTDLKGQWLLRMSADDAKKDKVQDVRLDSNSTPHFFFLQKFASRIHD